jgi:hypothetical protein
MASKMITHHTEFDANAINFSDVRKNQLGGKAVYLSNGNGKVMIELPKMRAPFGLGEFVDQSSGRTTYSINLSLDNNEDLQKKLRLLDDAIIKTVAKNSPAWLGKKHSEAVVRDALYSPIVKDPSDPKYAPTIKLKVQTDSNDKFVPKVFKAREPADLHELEKGQSMSSIVEVSQIWIINNKCGVSVRLAQAKLHPTDKLTEYAFRDDDDDEEVEETEEIEVEEEFDE